MDSEVHSFPPIQKSKGLDKALTTEYNTEQVHPNFSKFSSILIMANEALQIPC